MGPPAPQHGAPVGTGGAIGDRSRSGRSSLAAAKGAQTHSAPPRTIRDNLVRRKRKTRLEPRDGRHAFRRDEHREPLPASLVKEIGDPLGRYPRSPHMKDAHFHITQRVAVKKGFRGGRGLRQHPHASRLCQATDDVSVYLPSSNHEGPRPQGRSGGARRDLRGDRQRAQRVVTRDAFDCPLVLVEKRPVGLLGGRRVSSIVRSVENLGDLQIDRDDARHANGEPPRGPPLPSERAQPGASDCCQKEMAREREGHRHPRGE